DFESGTPVLTHPHKDEIGILLNRFEHLKKRLQYSKKELEKAQHQIYQAEKLASVGRLASGVAHEVNNPLNGMRFCVYSIKKDPENTTQTKEYLNLINEGLEQIESVVTKLLGYSRQRPTSIEPVVIDDKLKTVLELLEYRLKEKTIQVNIRRTSDIKHIKADPHLLQEMMMNLLLNSLDALDSFGSITITIGQPDLNTVSLSFHDNGTGIKKEDMKLIFDPFYSTKDTGKGTGLGLSVTQGIVELHHGTISVKSEPGSFTEFIVHLPITPENEHSHR
ncbi:ATP-binding protein, partial [Balneolaceae bacterium ANBcel3]|nr:ATP-binding protein [Balneolaceae bacterium ANBcel3]